MDVGGSRCYKGSGRKDAAFLAGGGDGLEAFRVFHYLPTADRQGIQGIQESMTNLLGHEDCLAWSNGPCLPDCFPFVCPARGCAD